MHLSFGRIKELKTDRLLDYKEERMRKKLIKKKIAFVAVFIVCMLTGCSEDYITSPSDVTITINPATTSLSIVGTTVVNYTATVKDANGDPMNKVVLLISGGFAAPRVPTRYTFFTALDGPAGLGVPANSGFAGVTDENGTYNFSVWLTVATY
ncbi:MAG: hypothetical protein KAR20_11830, partial [Candidatus Heimdallarchaeota archaeon]|nr:hypothetical protein [Candidatus Heimdallarchaeota archaeon]